MSLPTALLDGRAQNGDVPEIDPAARPQRRRFSAEYKQKILVEYEAALDGEKGSVLRREGLYSSQITKWRLARDAGALVGLEPGTRQPKRSATEVELEQLRYDRHCRIPSQRLQALNGSFDVRSLMGADLDSARLPSANLTRWR
jgi:transposase